MGSDMPEREYKQEGSSQTDDIDPGKKGRFLRLMENNLIEKACEYSLWFLIKIWQLLTIIVLLTIILVRAVVSRIWRMTMWTVKSIWKISKWSIKTTFNIMTCKNRGLSYVVLWGLLIIAIILFIGYNGLIIGGDGMSLLCFGLIMSGCVIIIISQVSSAILKKIMYDYCGKAHRESHPEETPNCIALLFIIVLLIGLIFDMPIEWSSNHYAIYDKAGNFVGCNILKPDPLAINCKVNTFKNDFIKALPTKGGIIIKLTDNVGTEQCSFSCEYKFTDRDKYLAAFSRFKPADDGKDPAVCLNEAFDAEANNSLSSCVSIWFSDMAKYQQLIKEKDFKSIAAEFAGPSADATENLAAELSEKIAPSLEKQWKDRTREKIAGIVLMQLKEKFPEMDITVN